MSPVLPPPTNWFHHHWLLTMINHWLFTIGCYSHGPYMICMRNYMYKCFHCKVILKQIYLSLCYLMLALNLQNSQQGNHSQYRTHVKKGTPGHCAKMLISDLANAVVLSKDHQQPTRGVTKLIGSFNHEKTCEIGLPQ